MNKKKTVKRLKAMQFIDFMKTPSGTRNNLRFGTGEYNHELMKFKICWQLRQERKEYFTEARLKNGRVADIFILDDMKIVEILNTETEEECKEKIKHYPQELEVVMVKANQEWNDKLIY